MTGSEGSAVSRSACLVLGDEAFDLVDLLRQRLLVLVVQVALGPLEPRQQVLQQLLGAPQLGERRGQSLLVLPGPSLYLWAESPNVSDLLSG